MASAPGATESCRRLWAMQPRWAMLSRGSHSSREPGAEARGWDVLVMGLPAAGDEFDSGHYLQHLELQGAWLERGLIAAADTTLLHSPLGLAGKRVLATMWFAAGSAWDPDRRDALLDAARAELEHDALRPRAGATAAHPQVVVLRVLADRVEPAMALLRRVRATWRALAWQLPSNPPRLWQT